MLKPALLTLTLGLGLLAVGAPSESALPEAALDGICRTALEQGNRVGVAVEVSVPGRGIYRKAFGQGDLVTGAARTPDAPFRIGSVTKTFFATAVLQEVEKGRIRLTDPLAKWYPNFPNAELITVDDLLRMQSGIQDPFDKAWLEHYYADPFWNLTADDVIAQGAALKDRFKRPGTVTEYVNLNYVLLEQILLKSTGMTADQALLQGIWAPLSLESTSYPTFAHDTSIPGPLHGYGWNGKSFDDKTLLNPVPPGGAGSMISTLDDLTVYGRALGKGTLLSPAAQARRLKMTPFAGSPAWVGYGQGIAHIGPFVGHNGTIQGFSTECFYFPAQDATIVVSVNRLDADDQSQSTDVFLKIAKELFPRAAPW